MHPVEKALWYIESHHQDPVSLDDVARVAGASRYHLSRVFSYATGLTLKRYLRDRRLSLAAARLAASQQTVLTVALDAGYASHEGFTRAFRDRFGVTPEQVSKQGHTQNLDLQEALAMNSSSPVQLSEPELKQLPPLLLAGVNGRCPGGNNAGIPAQWESFNRREQDLPDRQGNCAYGVVHNIDDDGNFEYLCAMEVSQFDRVPTDLYTLRLASCRYAAFFHAGHISEIQAVCQSAWADWIPNSEHEAVDAPFLEVYSASFDPGTGYGGFEIWIPVA